MPARPGVFSRIGGRLALVGAGLLAFTIAVVFAALFEISITLDREAVERTTKAVETALMTRQATLELTIVDYGAWGAAYENLSASTNLDWAFARGNLGESLYSDFKINGVLVVDPAGRTTYALIDGKRADVTLESLLGQTGIELVERARSAPENETVPVSSYVSVGTGNQLVAAAAFSTANDSQVEPVPGAASVLVFVDWLNAPKLLQLGDQFAVPALRAASLPSSDVHLTVPSLTGEPVAFAWTPPRPGMDLLNAVLPWLAAGTVLLALTTFLAYRNAMIAARAIDDGRKSLFESEARFRDIAEAASDWMWETDSELRTTYLSDRFSIITGRDRRELFGQPLGDFLLADLEEISALWKQAAPGKLPDLVCTYLDSAGLSRLGRICGKPVLTQDGVISGYRGTVTDITDEMAALNEIDRLARHDLITGLANRPMLEDYVSSLVDAARPQPSALICLDLDDFKSVNESKGYTAGDMMLAAFADRLQTILPPKAFLARLGGDKFAVALSVDDELHVSGWCEMFLSALEVPIDLDGDALRLGATAGIALFPKDAISTGDLLRKADIALVEAKRRRRGSYCFFSKDLDQVATERAQLGSDLRTAIAEGQFVLHYQPQFDARSMKPTSVEALIRWNHPIHGLVQPSVFIAAAEESGIIDAIGAWALETACRDIEPLNDLRVAVNVSPVQIRHQEAFSATVSRALQKSGLAPSRLELELTEYALMEEIVESRALFDELKSRGIRLALDDFGTGYSSLGNLRGFPFDKIKLDQSFVRESENSASARSIAEAVLRIGHALGMSVTAEGVETEAQCRMLAAGGFDGIQGYLLAKPMPLSALKDFIESGQRADLGQSAPPIPKT